MDEITLNGRVPLLVEPEYTTTVHNDMSGDDPLLVSSHGDINKKWIRIKQGDNVKFNTPLWFMQTTSGSRVFAAYETIGE